MVYVPDAGANLFERYSIDQLFVCFNAFGVEGRSGVLFEGQVFFLVPHPVPEFDHGLSVTEVFPSVTVLDDGALDLFDRAHPVEQDLAIVAGRSEQIGEVLRT